MSIMNNVREAMFFVITCACAVILAPVIGVILIAALFMEDGFECPDKECPHSHGEDKTGGTSFYA